MTVDLLEGSFRSLEDHMGGTGPVPKRDSERIRRNKPDVPTDIIEMIGAVDVPALGLEDPHPLVYDLYYSLRESGQSKYYEPSDWQFARMCMHFADKLLKSNSPSSVMLQQVNTMLSDLLVAEGQRRRVRLEVERDHDNQGKVIDVADMFRERFLKPAV